MTVRRFASIGAAFAAALFVFSAGPTLAQSAPGQTAADPVSEAYAKIAAYQVGATTLGEFQADNWQPSDAVRGKVGVIAGRREGAVSEYMLGSCGDLHDDNLVLMLDRASGMLSSTLFANADFFWPDGMVSTGCERRYHLRFNDGVLASMEQLVVSH